MARVIKETQGAGSGFINDPDVCIDRRLQTGEPRFRHNSHIKFQLLECNLQNLDVVMGILEYTNCRRIVFIANQQGVLLWIGGQCRRRKHLAGGKDDHGDDGASQIGTVTITGKMHANASKKIGCVTSLGDVVA